MPICKGSGVNAYIFKLAQERSTASATTATDSSGGKPSRNPKVLISLFECYVPVNKPEEGLVFQFCDATGQVLELLRGHLSAESSDNGKTLSGEGASDSLDRVNQLYLVLFELVLIDGR